MNKKLQELLNPYNPKDVENKIYKLWEKSGFFNPDKLPLPKSSKLKAKSFSIIMPPPNANGSLHIGHAVFIALQDIMIRYHRMKGEKTLWLPGADHAGFETQVVYDKKLEKEGRSRFQIPRNELYQEMLKFTLENKKVMENQLRKLGASCDWSREKFTLDKDIIKIVYSTFEKLKKDGLVYRGKRVVNWCVKHQTSLSDIELKYEERKSRLYYVKYLMPELNKSVTVATTRPETIPADAALAVNPKDKRYKKFIGKCAVNPLNSEKLPIIGDAAVDKDFGTGVLKITPDHDRLDEEIYSRHPEINKKSERVINLFGRLEGKSVPKGILGLKVREAREAAVELLKNNNSLDENFSSGGIDENYANTAALCYKCGSEIEPLSLDNQWFIKMAEKPKSGGDSLRDMAVGAVKSGKARFIPKRFEKIFFHWMKNIKDWNISRQIAWGIKIPGKDSDDVFDTWFSSGQWPFATLMAGKKNDFEKFYPTDVMETGHDILFFWVARMIMLGLYVTGDVPFKNVYLHGLVRDKDRQKMSKSKGNVVDPLGIVDAYGADALRMALVVGNTPGNDIIISEDKIRGYRNFANKIWNASRFVLTQLTQNGKFQIPNSKSQIPRQTSSAGIPAEGLGTNSKFQIPNHKLVNLTKNDKKRLKELDNFTKEITRLMDSFKFYAAAEKLYHYFWHTFADKIIEESKARLQGENQKEREAAQYVLRQNLATLLKLLHPFMPFITEKIWSLLPDEIKTQKLLIIEPWPKYK